MNEHPQNKAAFENEDFHFTQNDVVHVAINFDESYEWEYEKKNFIGDSDKFNYKVTPMTITVFDDSGM